jgi:hypothetical protein
MQITVTFRAKLHELKESKAELKCQMLRVYSPTALQFTVENTNDNKKIPSTLM